MAIVTFELEDFERSGYGSERLGALLPEVGIEVEAMGEKEVSINVTPNRPDLLDFTGVLRVLNSFTGKKEPLGGYYEVGNEPVLTIEVDKGVQGLRPYIAGLVVKNVDLSGNMLKYLINFTEKFADTYGRKRAKLAIGVHSLDAIDGGVITYTASGNESFVPLGASKKMGFDEIVKSSEKGMAYGYTIPGAGTGKATYPLIRDSSKILAMIPITNSEATKVTERTTELFIDITGTSLPTIRNAASLLACSFRYAGAEIYPVTVAYRKGAEVTPQIEYREVKIRMGDVERTLGVEAGRHDIIALANKMDYVAGKYGNSVIFLVPPYRVDVLNEQDVIEDVAIAFGYNNIVPLPVAGVADGLPEEIPEQENRFVSLMVGMGYTEAMNSALTNEKANFDNMQKSYREGEYVGIADSRTMNVTMLRTSLLPCLLQNLRDSMTERMPQRLFEVGRVYKLDGGKLGESVHLSLVCEDAKANFAEIRSAVDNILGYSDVGNAEIEEFKDSSFIEGRCACVKLGGDVIGVFGEVHPQTLGNFGLEEPVVAAELVVIREIKYDV